MNQRRSTFDPCERMSLDVDIKMVEDHISSASSSSSYSSTSPSSASSSGSSSSNSSPFYGVSLKRERRESLNDYNGLLPDSKSQKTTPSPVMPAVPMTVRNQRSLK
jgi:hypothetical protein